MESPNCSNPELGERLQSIRSGSSEKIEDMMDVFQHALTCPYCFRLVAREWLLAKAREIESGAAEQTE